MARPASGPRPLSFLPTGGRSVGRSIRLVGGLEWRQIKRVVPILSPHGSNGGTPGPPCRPLPPHVEVQHVWGKHFLNRWIISVRCAKILCGVVH
eukprot:gene14518-biopygen577